jgi:cadmium resistance protein CadD (predicted permease)
VPRFVWVFVTWDTSVSTMQQLMAAVLVALIVFVTTNVDDLFVLLTMFGDETFRAREVVVGQLVAMFSLVALSCLGALLAIAIAPAYVGLLGLAPLGIGIAALLRQRGAEDEESPLQLNRRGSGVARVIAVTLVTMANGGDNLAVYIPLFASRSRIEQAIMATVFLLMTAAWCWVAQTLINHPRLGAPIRRYSRPASPYVLIALGVYILIDSKSYTVFAG